MKKIKVIEKGLKKDFEQLKKLLNALNKMYVRTNKQMFEWEYETTCMYIYGSSTDLINLYSLLYSTTEHYSLYMHWSIEHGQYIEVIALM